MLGKARSAVPVVLHAVPCGALPVIGVSTLADIRRSDMAFPDAIVIACWDMVGGVCERCRKSLVWANRGRVGIGAWEAHHIDGNPDNDMLTNCEILCWPCHESTLSSP